MRRKILALLAATMSTAAHAQEKVAFFGLTLLDGSVASGQAGEVPAELVRITLLERMVAERFAEEGYELVDTDPARDAIDSVSNIAKCNGCDTRIATELGAKYSLVGEVHKTSNLILAINLQMRSADTGEMVKGAVVDIRGTTDEDWQRGMRYILKNRFFTQDTN
jgi:hypothetical protein